MAVNITFDNDRTTVGLENVTHDQNAGAQTQISTDDGDEVDVINGGGTISGLTTVMNGILNGATIFKGFFTLDATQEAYLANVDGASSSLDFVKVEVTNGEVIDDLFFSDANGADLEGVQVVGMQTLDGEDVYLWSDGNLAIATTSGTLGAGRLVGVFCLHEDADHLNAQIQFVALEPLSHPDADDPDDTLDFTDVLNVSASGSISFDFDNLESGNFLWVAIGNSSAGLLVTGQDLNVNDTAGNKQGDITKGGSDPSDSMNTSQGGINATIGVNAQHFTDGPKVNGADTDGPVAVFTLVNGYVPLANNPLEQATGINVKQINYDAYVNTSSVDIFISQTTGNADANMKISLFNASLVGGTPEEGYSGANPYIGNQDTDSALKDDAEVNVGSVSIGSDTWLSTDAGIGSGITKNGVTVSINGNDVVVDGVTTADTITVEALSGTFNRFNVQGLAGTADFDIGRIDIDNVVGDTEAVGGMLLVDDDGPKIGDSDGVSDPIADSLLELVVGAKAENVTLGGAIGTDPDEAPAYTLVDYTSSISINGLELQAVPNNATPSLVTGVTYYHDTNGNDTFGDAGDDAFYSLTLSDSANSGAGGYTFEVLKTPPPATLDFFFDNLESGNFLWVAIGSEAGGLLVTGQDLNVNDSGPKAGDLVKGGSDPSDSVNTSQGGIGATIGINAQHFTDGPKVNGADTDGSVAVFTLTTGFVPLPTTGAGEATGINVNEIDYGNYLNTGSAELFISQTTSNGDAIMKISLYNASLVGGTPEEKQGGSNPYIGNDTTDAALKDDAEVLAGTVTIGNLSWSWDEAGIGAGLTKGSGANAITVSINGNDIVVNGVTTGQTVEFSARSGTFNRFDLQGLAGSADFDVGRVSLGFDLDTPDQLFEFTAKAIDGDNDSALACWQVGIDGTGANNDNLVAGLEEDCTPVDGTVSSTLSALQEMHSHELLMHDIIAI